MPQETENEQVRRAAPLRNPAAGAVLAVRAGNHLAAEFDFVNDSPDVAVFDLQVDGLPDPSWLNVDAGRYSAPAAASGAGSLIMVLDPPASAAVGDYSFSVTIVSGGSAIGQGRIPLVLRVDAAPVQPAPRAARKPTAPKPDADGEAKQAAAQVTPPPSQRAIDPPVPPKPRAPAPRKAKVEEAPIAPVEPEEPQLVLRPGTRPVEPEPQIEAGFEREPEAEPEPEIRPAPRPTSVPQAAVEEDLPVVDYDSHIAGQREEEEEDDQELAITERSVLDPAEGSIFSLCPGDTLLVRFSFVNDSPSERTYILDEDRSLETGWITLVQDQVNLTRNGRGEVALRLTPPKNAEPGDYPFSVSTGLQGGVLSSVPLTLAVQAMPAVKLSVKQPVISLGALSNAADFHLMVESAGNADTAFRLGVKNPEVSSDTASGAQKPDIIYESPHWRYLFDREMEDLRSPSYGKAPQPVPIRLRLLRRGIWWFGFRESHTVRVATIPVTEPNNNNKAGNTVEVTAKRWRILPVPLLVFLPVLIAAYVFFLAQGARSLDVSNAYRDPQGQFWVVNPAGDHKDLTVTWQAPSFAPLHLSAKTGDQTTLSKTVVGSGSYHTTVPVSSQDRRTISVYRISRLMGG
ncbi:MAG TPA: hypothetical protein VFW40_05110, partial [Capsulimonadaceae bacterium]|nr:hypothetical protein [Capsulimonadaceae bacterium]